MDSMLLHMPMLQQTITSSGAAVSYSPPLSSDSSHLSGSDEPSSPQQDDIEEKLDEGDGDDLFMDDDDDDDDPCLPGSNGRRNGGKSSGGNQKVICDCKACCSMGKTRWVSKSTRSRHRRRFSVAMPFSSSPVTTVSVLSSGTPPVTARIQRGRPRIHPRAEDLDREQQQQQQHRQTGAGIAPYGGEGIDTPQHSRTLTTGVAAACSSEAVSGGGGHIVLVNKAIDDHLNPQRQPPPPPPPVLQQPQQQHAQEQKPAGAQPDVRRPLIFDDPIERITVTLFRDILSSLWTEFCA
eukprot:TRINITY_DN3345_c0_g1_i1.p1 TRINITY_DN3345_c0_g1~~TRINITY_DN3345_c0_g1_i1.p1  ORF type:complete len:294 (+),score=59.93 TRINITY_DN3345_c0_g1_i1:119-1000(+)